MALSYPLTMLDYGIASVSFDPDESVANMTNRNADKYAMGLAPTIWKCTFETHPLRGEKYDEWRAWVSSLELNGSFYIWDWQRQYPRSCPNGFGGMVRAVGGAAFDGTFTLTSVNALDAHEVSVSGLPASFQFKLGDYIAFDYSSGTRRAFHRVVGNVTLAANGTGMITVTPPVVPGWTASTTINSYRAMMVAQICDRKDIDYGMANVGSGKQIIRVTCYQKSRKA